MLTRLDDRPCHWRPTFSYAYEVEDGECWCVPYWTDRWHLVDADGSEVRDNGELIIREMPLPDWPLPECAWDGVGARRP